MEIFTNFLYQIVFTVWVVVAFALIIALCRKAFYYIVGDNATKVILATGIIGTPIHEISHAIMCIIFGHKITEIKLYQPNSDDGTLGYVNHSYNAKNWYHQIGNFFIGVAPIVCGSGVLLLLMFLLVPGVFTEVMSELEFVGLLSMDFLDITTYLAYLDIFFEIIKDIFHFTNMGNVYWWIFIILAFMISSHMELSLADIKGGFKGFVFMAILLLVADTIMYFAYYPALETVTMAMNSFALYIIGFLAISGIFAGIQVLLALIIKNIAKLRKK